MNHSSAGLRIEAREVVKQYDGKTILDRLSLSVGTGETLALIGPSGSGKSTLLRCLNALVTIEGGAITVGDLEISPQTHATRQRQTILRVRRQFGMVFQEFNLFPHRTALGNIVEAPIHVRGLAPAEARELALKLLARVNLEDKAGSYPDQLSGGQKQRVAIARALAMQPRALLFDEPTSALDPELRSEVRSVIEDLKSDGLTMLMVTHEIGLAERVADRVVFLDRGRVVEEGSPRELLRSPQTARAQEFLRHLKH